MLNKLNKIIRCRLYGAPIAIFHKFVKPPYGGSNQFMMALKAALESAGYDVMQNRAGSNTKACLLNAHLFDSEKVKKIRKRYGNIKMVQRVDGPISVYRGWEDGTDETILRINRELADITIFQSNYSLNKHIELGMYFKNPVVIPNSVSSDIFYSRKIIPRFDGQRKIRLIATSWSDNPGKGGPVYKWIDDHLDWDRYEFTFVGRTKEQFSRIKHVQACASERLSEILRQHDIYITASQNDPCSNSLIEALSCGLPAVFLKSGGHAELVSQAGIGFNENEEAIAAIDKVSEEYEFYQSLIKVVPIEEVAKRYAEVMLNEDHSLK